MKLETELRTYDDKICLLKTNTETLTSRADIKCIGLVGDNTVLKLSVQYFEHKVRQETVTRKTLGHRSKREPTMSAQIRKEMICR